MKPYIHAKNSAKKFGGKPEDYLPIHNKMDSTKSAHADYRHRCIFHSAFGVFIIEDIFGVNITNSDGDLVSVRDIAEQHVIEDMGTIPSLSDWLKGMPIEGWMSRVEKKEKKTGNIFVEPVPKLPDITPSPWPPLTGIPPFPKPVDIID